ncbi:MAG: acyl-CoA dehydrogenase family protein [Acidimicrobiia bacterium]
MRFAFSSEDLAWQAGVRAWAVDALEPGWRERYPHGSPEWIDFQKGWERLLHQGGWGGVFWPVEHGGLGASPSRRVLFSQAMAEVGAPEGLGKLGKRLLAPMLMDHGTPAQQARFLPPILRGEEFWCQGFSEPDAGSDLASLRTRAERRDDWFHVEGQKIWTSYAHHFDWCVVLVRTGRGETKHEGVSVLLVDLRSPGIEIRPIRQINGQSDFAQVFFDDVRVPAENLVGPLDEGWRVVRSLLAHERGAEQAFSRFVEARAGFEELLALLGPDDRSDADAEAVGRMQGDLFAAQVNAMRLLSTQLAGGNPDELSSVLKLQHSEAWRRASAAKLQVLGSRHLADGSRGHSSVLDYLMARAVTIAGGTSEVQREVIAKRLLGMR